MKYIAGSAPDGKRIRESTGTTSWEKARKILARKLAENEPVNKPLFGAVSGSKRKAPTTKTIADAIDCSLRPSVASLSLIWLKR